MEKIASLLAELVKAIGSIPWVSTLMSIIWFLLIAIAVGGVICAIAGKKSPINRGISAMFVMVLFYMAAIFLGVYIPSFREVLSNLPFLSINDEGIRLLNPLTLSLSTMFPAMLRFFILAFLFNCTESFMPTGSSVLSWSFWRFMSSVLAVLFYAAVCFILNAISGQILGGFAFIFVLAIVFFAVLLVFLRFLFKRVLSTDNAKFNSLYEFFTMNSFGNQFAKMVETTILSIGTLAWFDHKGYCEILFSQFNVLVFWPVALLFAGTQYVFSMIYNEGRK